MIRGGSWNNNSNNCRASYRNNNSPDNSNNNIGFRVASTPPPELPRGISAGVARSPGAKPGWVARECERLVRIMKRHRAEGTLVAVALREAHPSATARMPRYAGLLPIAARISVSATRFFMR